MSLLEAIILGVVQGLTEFLPISSTAHLRIVPALAGWKDPGPAFSAVIQCGTLVAVLAYFRQDVLRIATAWLTQWQQTGKPGTGDEQRSADVRLGWMVIFGTVPVIVCGLVFKDAIKSHLRSLYVIAGMLVVVGFVMLAAEAFAWWHKRRATARGMDNLRGLDAAIVGLAQALALVPGTSRSGITISAGLFAGLSREAAARFSFLLSLPAIFAAGMHELVSARKDLLGSPEGIVNLVVATVVSGVVGYASIAFLLAYVRRHTTVLFVVYRFLLAGLLLWLLTRGYVPANEPLSQGSL